MAYYNENSFWYYTDNHYRAFVANLIAVKNGAERCGGLLLV